MHDHGTSSTEHDDLRDQSAVLSLVLDGHPTLLAASEIAREMGPGDAVERAMRDLTGAGLLRREGETVLPTRAALHFERLES
jgi:hypothetical protein